MFTKEKLLRFEVFPAELPPCFGTGMLADHSEYAINAANEQNMVFSIPLKYSGYKSESARRTFAIPNPVHYCKAVDVIVKNEEEIAAILNGSNFSLTAPIEGSPRPRQAYAKKSGCIADTKAEIEMQYQNNRYEIRLDISAFFDSIYTHSIPWAIHTIPVAKKNKFDMTLLGNQLDKRMQAMNYNQTNGILVGNAVSRIIAEIILCTIDKAIENKFRDIKCRRFVDDYYIYTKDSGRIQEIISFIRTNLAQYELCFNENKIQVNESPFLYGKPWVEQIKQYMHLQPDIFLSKMIMEYNTYKDIAIIKYGLKVISECRYSGEDWPALQSRLINLWVRFPSLSEHIHPILWYNKTSVSKMMLRDAVYSVIEESILLNREQELIWAVWFAKVYNITLRQKTIGSVLKSKTDVAIIIMLDYIFARGLEKRPAIKDYLSELYDELKQEDIDMNNNPNQLMWTSRWLLAYEADRNGWLNNSEKTFDFAKQNVFFKKLLDKNVMFYNPKYKYAEPPKQTRNYEYATRSEMYVALDELKKMIAQRLQKAGAEESFEMSHEENQKFEKFMRAYEHEESVYVG